MLEGGGSAVLAIVAGGALSSNVRENKVRDFQEEMPSGCLTERNENQKWEP